MQGQQRDDMRKMPLSLHATRLYLQSW